MLRVMKDDTSSADLPTCRQCKTSKPLTDFYADTYSPKFLRQPCKECHRANRRKSYADGPGSEQALGYLLKKKYGLSLEQYNQMLTAQGNRCAVCRQPETVKSSYGKPQRLSVDHDHATGKVRGLLCLRCNKLAGIVENNYNVIPLAKEYIRRHNEAFSQVEDLSPPKEN